VLQSSVVLLRDAVSKKPQRVRCDKHGRSGVGKDGHPQRADAEQSGCEKHGLQAEGNGDVLPDVGERGAGESDQLGDTGHAVSEHCRVGRLQGHVLLLLFVVGRRHGTPTGLALATHIALGIGLHNLGEGLAIGAAFAAGVAGLGAFLVLGFTLHNVNYLKPGPDDVPLTPREAFVSGINKIGLCGRHRQDVIADCRPGDEIILIRQPDNPHDKEAIVLVRAATAEDIGFLPAATADEIAPRLDKGSPVTARFECAEPFETDDGKRLLGVRIMLAPHKLRRKSEAPQAMRHMPYVAGTYRTPEGE
jgi:hypothetical protein